MQRMTSNLSVVVADRQVLLLPLVECLKKQLPNVKFHPFPDEEQTNEDGLKLIRESEVLLAATSNLPKFTTMMPKLKWAQSTWAGVESLFTPQRTFVPNPAWTLTRSGGYMGRLMAEYVLCCILCRERKMLEIHELQKSSNWDNEAVACKRSLSGLTITIVGLGDIGMEVARKCKQFGMRVLGVKRTVSSDYDRSVVDEIGSMSQLAIYLSDSDYICSILPKTGDTDGVYTKDILQRCAPKKPVFINVGRANVINNSDLISALDNDYLSAAILDVTEPEPLPKDNPLWSHPKVRITPHVSAPSLAKETAETFVLNYKRYVNKEPLKYQVDWDKGY